MKPSNESLKNLKNTLNDWALIYGRSISEEETEIWLRIFESTPPPVLALAIDHITKNSERRPTPGMLTKAIAITYEQHPELLPKTRLLYRVGKDTNGVPCIFWSDDAAVPAYRAPDCPEGRAFLATLALVAGVSAEESARLMEKYVSGGKREPGE